jgi:predicted nucleotidyltransferase
MMQRDPNVDSVELVVNELGALCDELVLVGGCAVGLLITDKARPMVRPTKDVDLIAEVVSQVSYYKLQAKLEALGFRSGADEVICRWQKGELLIDVMPTEEIGFGSTNRWYPLVVRNAEEHTLPRGGIIRVISAPLFVAAKLEAFQNRGEGDYGHHDIEDIVNIVDGRIELAEEIRRSDNEVRSYIMQEFDDLLADKEFAERLPWHMNTDDANQRRVPMVLGRFREIAGL